MNSAQFAAYLDATNLKLDASHAEICTLCDEAAEAGYASVCVYPESVSICSSILYASEVKVCTVIGFPHGRSSKGSMQSEILNAKELGAHEVDIVMNYPALRSGERNYVTEQIQLLCQSAKEIGLLTKVIVETCYLEDTQKLTALKICESAGADFIKTSTGFGRAGATVEDIALFQMHRNSDIRIKASGGIRDIATAMRMIDAGASRLGVSSASSLLAELNGQSPTPMDAGSY